MDISWRIVEALNSLTGATLILTGSTAVCLTTNSNLARANDVDCVIMGMDKTMLASRCLRIAQRLHVQFRNWSFWNTKKLVDVMAIPKTCIQGKTTTCTWHQMSLLLWN